MIKRTVEISRAPAHLAVRHEQLLIQRRGERPADAAKIPCEDLGLVMALISAYRFMWVVAMFDLPVHTREGRRAYARFRTNLLRDGFSMMQFSVYIRHCASRENADVHIQRVEGMVPDKGEVRLLTITDKQFERMRVFWGKQRKPPEPAPNQLELF